MDYKIEQLNGGDTINVKSIEVDYVNVFLSDDKNNIFELQLTVEDLNINDKVLKELNNQYGV
tara:strand:+ start:952 stop:1137 length:186 start_codon:yes stop_codon:yes gene_type:complete